MPVNVEVRSPELELDDYVLRGSFKTLCRGLKVIAALVSGRSIRLYDLLDSLDDPERAIWMDYDVGVVSNGLAIELSVN